MGHFENCRCQPRKRKKRDLNSTDPDFRWGGCSDNLQFGVDLAKIYLDGRELGHDIKAFINLRNNELGRMVIAFSII